MKKLIAIISLIISGQCFGATFDLDTIDNWQIYNGTELILSGHIAVSATPFQVTLWYGDIEDLKIKDNHCFPVSGFSGAIELVNSENQSVIYKKKFPKNTTDLIINRKDILGLVRNKTIMIKYSEKGEKEMQMFLGLIKVE